MERAIEKEELRSIMLSILSDIHQWCETNGTQYFLSYGTLLGAVRHHGFIPWDDDIDIWMPRPDYDRFISEYQHEFYKVISPYNDKDYPLEYAKVHDPRTVVLETDGDGNWGVFVDVFALDGIPSEKVFARTKRKVSMIHHIVSNQRFTRKFKLSGDLGLKKNIHIVLGRIMHPFLSLNRVLLWEDRVKKKNRYQGSPFTTDFGRSHSRFFDKSVFSEQIPMEFEGKTFMAPVKYHECLSMLYGDYMTPPPADKQVSNHGILGYWK